jgi:hypothetical protein
MPDIRFYMRNLIFLPDFWRNELQNLQNLFFRKFSPRKLRFFKTLVLFNAKLNKFYRSTFYGSLGTGNSWRCLADGDWRCLGSDEKRVDERERGAMFEQSVAWTGVMTWVRTERQSRREGERFDSRMRDGENKGLGLAANEREWANIPRAIQSDSSGHYSAIDHKNNRTAHQPLRFEL